jgi:hypothetical protein
MTLEQTTNPTQIPLTGLGYGPMANLYGQQLVPQSPIGNILSQLGSVSPYAVHPQLALQAQLGTILSQLGALQQQPYGLGQQFGLQGLQGQQQPFGMGQQFGLQGLQGQQQPFGVGQQFGLQGLQSPITSILGQFGQVSPFAGGQQFGQQSPFGSSQLGHINPFAVAQQQQLTQSLIGAILSQLAVNPLLIAQLSQITQNPYLNPYAQIGAGIRQW